MMSTLAYTFLIPKFWDSPISPPVLYGEVMYILPVAKAFCNSGVFIGPLSDS